MPAPLGEILILELDRVGAGLLKAAHRAHDIERVAIAGVGVDDQVRIDAVADQRQRIGDLAHADEADIRPPEPGVGDRGARDIERGEPGLGGDQCGEGVIDAWRHHDGLAGQASAQSFRVSHGHIPR